MKHGNYFGWRTWLCSLKAMGKKLALVHCVGRQGYQISLQDFLARNNALVLPRQCVDMQKIWCIGNVLGLLHTHQEVHTSKCLACDLGLNSTSTGDLSGRQVLASLRSLKYLSDEFFEQKKLGASRETQVYINPCTHMSSKNKAMPAWMVCKGSKWELAGISERSQSRVWEKSKAWVCIWARCENNLTTWNIQRSPVQNPTSLPMGEELHA